MNNIDVVYTPVNNLKKTSGMDVGQVGFHKDKEVNLLFFCWLLIEDIIFFSLEIIVQLGQNC